MAALNWLFLGMKISFSIRYNPQDPPVIMMAKQLFKCCSALKANHPFCLMCEPSAAVSYMNKTDDKAAKPDIFLWHVWMPERLWVRVSLEVQILTPDSQRKIVWANLSTACTLSNKLWNLHSFRLPASPQSGAMKKKQATGSRSVGKKMPLILQHAAASSASPPIRCWFTHEVIR